MNLLARSAAGRLLAAGLGLAALWLPTASPRAAAAVAPPTATGAATATATATATAAPPAASATAAPPAASAAAPAPVPAESKEEMRSYRILFQEEIYSYNVFVPRGFRSRPAGPVVMLLHGVGGSGPWSIAAWHDFADEQGLLLVAPTLPFGPQFEPLVPTLLRSILAEVKGRWTYDPHRVYLFGHSAGGILAFDAALLDSDLFAAAAVHAAVIYRKSEWALPRARRKIPIALYVGDHDEYFPLDLARHTRDLLKEAGFPLHYVELPGHNHDFHAVAAQVESDAWAFLSPTSLPG